MSIDKDLSDRPMEDRSPGDSLGKEGVPADPAKVPVPGRDRSVPLPTLKSFGKIHETAKEGSGRKGHERDLSYFDG